MHNIALYKFLILFYSILFYSNVSRSSNKVTVDKQGITVKPKPKEAEPRSKVDTSHKPVKSDHCPAERKPDIRKVVEKSKPVDHGKAKLHDIVTVKVKVDDRSGNSKHKVAPSPGGKTSSSDALLSDKKSAASQKYLNISMSSISTSSGGSSGSESSSSDSDTTTTSSSSSDSSNDEDTAANSKKPSQPKQKLPKDSRSKPVVIHSEPQKAAICDVSDSTGNLDRDSKAKAEKISLSNDKEDMSNKSRDRRSLEGDRKKQISLNRHRSRSSDRSTANKESKDDKASSGCASHDTVDKPVESFVRKEDTTLLHKSTGKDRTVKMAKADKTVNDSTLHETVVKPVDNFSVKEDRAVLHKPTDKDRNNKTGKSDTDKTFDNSTSRETIEKPVDSFLTKEVKAVLHKSTDKDRTNNMSKADRRFNDSASHEIVDKPAEIFSTKDAVVSHKSTEKETNKETRTVCKSEPAADHTKVSSDVRVPVAEEPAPSCSAELYSPSSPTDLDGGWGDEVCGDGSRWSSSSDDDEGDVPPPSPPPRPPSNIPQPSAGAGPVNVVDNCKETQSSAVPKSVIANSKQDVITMSSGHAAHISGSVSDTPPCSGTRHVSNARKPTDGGFVRKDGVERAVPELDNGCAESVTDDGKSSFSRHDKRCVSGSKSQTELDAKHRDRSGSSHTSGRSRRSRSRPRSQERRPRTSKDGGRSKDFIDRQSGAVLDKTASRQHDVQHPQSPTIHVDSPRTFPVRSSLAQNVGSCRLLQNSDSRPRSSSRSSSRSASVTHQSSSTTSRNVFNSDEPVVVIDTDDEDVEESIEGIPLPPHVPNTILDDIPLPACFIELSDPDAKDDKPSEIHSVEKKSDSTLEDAQGKESVCEKQKIPEEEEVRVEADNVDNIDMDLDDNSDNSGHSSEMDSTTVSPGTHKGPMFSQGKIVLSIGGSKKPGQDRTTPNMASSSVMLNAVAWKRKLAAGLLKAPKIVSSNAESVPEVDSPTEKSNKKLVSDTSSKSEFKKESDSSAEVKYPVFSKKLSPQMKVSSKSDAASSLNALVVEKRNSSGSNSGSTAAVKQKARRRFSDAPPEKSTDSIGDPHSNPRATNVHSVKVERSYHVLTGQQHKQQHGKRSKDIVSQENEPHHSVMSHTDYKNPVTEKSSKSTTANQMETTYHDKKVVARTEHKSESSQLKNSSSFDATKARKNSESARSISPVLSNSNTEQHRSSRSRAEKTSPSNDKQDMNNFGSNKSRGRRSSEDDRKKTSSNRRRSRSSDRSTGNKQQRNLSPEREFHSSRERAAKGDSRYSSVRGKDSSPEGRLHTSKERGAKGDNRSVRKSSGDRNADKLSHDMHRTSGKHSDVVGNDMPSSSSVHGRSPRLRSPSDMRREQEINRSPHPHQSTSREKLAGRRHEQDDRKPHSHSKTESQHHSSSYRQDDTAAKHSHMYQENWSCSDKDASNRNNDLNSRRSSSRDRISRPHLDGKMDKSRHAADIRELWDHGLEVGRSRRSPSYDQVVFQHEIDVSRDRHRSASKERHSFPQSRDYSRPNVEDYSSERLSSDVERSRKMENFDRYERSRRRRSSSRENEAFLWQETGDFSTERFLRREEDREHLDRRRDSSENRHHRSSSPSDWLELSRRTKHSSPPNERQERSTFTYKRSLSRECSPEYRRHALIDRIERSPSFRDAESMPRRFDKRPCDRDERSSSRGRRDASHCRSPSRKEQVYAFERQRSITPGRRMPASPVGRESFAQIRRSLSRDGRFVDGRESNRAYHSSRSPSQRGTDLKRASPHQSRYSLLEEQECSLRRKHSTSTERRSPSADRKRRRKSPERQSRSHDRRSRSHSRESPSIRGRKYHPSQSDRKEDTSSRSGSRSPSLQPPRESRHSNRDIVQFLMDTGIIASSKSGSSSRDTKPVADTVVAKPLASVVSMPVTASQSVTISVASATQLSNSSVASSYPVVPAPALMQGSVMPQVPYVDNSSVQYMPCPAYPAAPYLPGFPAVPAGAPNPWFRPPGLQPCHPFPNQANPVPYPGMQPVPAVPGMGPRPPGPRSLLGPPPGPPLPSSAMHQCVVPGVHSTPARDWQGPFSQTYGAVPDTVNQPNFIQQEDRTRLPQPTFGASVNDASSRSADRRKQELELRPHHSSNSALIKAIADSAVWIPKVDSCTPKATQQVTASKSSDLLEDKAGNKTHVESSVMDSSEVIETAEKMPVREESTQQQASSDLLSVLHASPAGCLWECIPEIVVDAKSLAAMEASNDAEGLATESDGRGKKRWRGHSASEGAETRRRSSRLRSKEEKKPNNGDDISEDQASDPALKLISDTEQSKPPVKNLKARILQEYESDTGNPNPSSNGSMTEAALDVTASANPVTDAGYKVPADLGSPSVTKPEKVKSRWRRWSELESDGEQGRQPPQQSLSSQSPQSTTAVGSASDVKDIVEEKPPYFEPILDNIFLSLRLVFCYSYT